MSMLNDSTAQYKLYFYVQCDTFTFGPRKPGGPWDEKQDKE